MLFKKTSLSLLLLGASLFAAPEVVHQTYIAKYLGAVSQSDWEDRGGHGEIVTVYTDGSTHTDAYLEGKRHGKSVATFPHSDKVAKAAFFEEGRLIKEVDYFVGGGVRQETEYSKDGKTVSVFREAGGLQSSETFHGPKIVQGSYFDEQGREVSKVIANFGERSFLGDGGKLLAQERVENGERVMRTQFHDNGFIQCRVGLRGNLPSGNVEYYAKDGSPQRMEQWQAGVRNGTTTLYQDGLKIREVTYKAGKKEGLERIFKSGDHLSEEISWKNDKRHGATVLWVEGQPHTTWYYEGKKVNKITFDFLSLSK